MPKPQTFLSSQEFARKAGVSAGTVSKWLRQGTINGEKKHGKWAIAPDELSKVSAAQKSTIAHHKSPPPRTSDPAAQSYSVQEFSAMTYLTDFGVRKWLKEGLLEKFVDAQGEVRVHGDNLDKPRVKRLLR